MRVLITGAHGQVGQELMHSAPASWQVSGFGSKELDIRDAQLVLDTVQKLQPQLIINAAAYTAVDKAESDQDCAKIVPTQLISTERATLPQQHSALIARCCTFPQTTCSMASTTSPIPSTTPQHPIASTATVNGKVSRLLPRSAASTSSYAPAGCLACMAIILSKPCCA